jgi:hypothetical protein
MAVRLVITATSMEYIEHAVEQYAEGFREGHHDRNNHWLIESE